jgi:hypothetical protein
MTHLTVLVNVLVVFEVDEVVAERLREHEPDDEAEKNTNTSTSGNRTLAAAYAEAGDFPNAMSSAQRALDLAEAKNDNSMVLTLSHDIVLCQSSTPYREWPPE